MSHIHMLDQAVAAAKSDADVCVRAFRSGVGRRGPEQTIADFAALFATWPADRVAAMAAALLSMAEVTS